MSNDTAHHSEWVYLPQAGVSVRADLIQKAMGTMPRQMTPVEKELALAVAIEAIDRQCASISKHGMFSHPSTHGLA